MLWYQHLFLVKERSWEEKTHYVISMMRSNSKVIWNKNKNGNNNKNNYNDHEYL